MDAKFQISADEQIIGPVCDFTYSWSLNCGVPANEARRFTIAVSELVTDIILFAYPRNSKASLDLSFRNALSNIELVVTEVGEPFDPDRHRYDPQKALQEGDFEGAGLRLIRRFCDEFLFINKGKEGKEFRLSKNIAVREIDERIERSRSEKPDETDIKKIEKPELSASDFGYSQIQPSDAEDIAKLIYRTYEYTYSKEDLYFPKKIEQTLLGKEKLGVITRNNEGLAVGYFAVLKKQDSNIAEVGEAVVSPAYRKRGIMSKMMEHLIEISRKNKLAGVFGKAVTLHPVSQKVNHKFNFKSTALMLADTPRVKFKGFDESYPQPVSVVVDFLPLTFPASKDVYIPEKYQDIVLKTYRELDLPVNSAKSSAQKMAKQSDIELEISYANATALLVVKKYGPDFRSVLADMLQSLKEQEDLNAIYLDLPLENSATPEQYKQIDDLGFFYSGLVPLFHEDADFLRLQQIYIQMDLDLIEVYSDFGKNIKSFIADEYHRHT
jgi:anti-sigma regulatory factor (Ser/Thr protein kinase)/N-acetylglutamate synthase-like GNAT family acetyltransferase